MHARPVQHFHTDADRPGPAATLLPVGSLHAKSHFFHSQHELRDDLKEYTMNTMMMFRPNGDAGVSFLTQAFEQTSFRDKVEAVVSCYTRMVQRIKEVKGW